MTLPSDEILLAQFAKGDREAFDRLTRRYTGPLDAYFRRRLPDDGRGEELRQETLLALYAILPSYREVGRFRSLVFSIAYRKLVSSRRGEVPRSPFPDNAPAAPRAVDAFEVREAVARLPEGLREALLLTRFEGLSAVEAGEVLECSAEAVRARVYRATAVLAKRFTESGRKK